MSGVKRWEAEDNAYAHDEGEFVKFDDYERLEQELDNMARDNQQLTFALSQEQQAYIELRDEVKDALKQVEAMRAALERAAKGILWLQASVPMSLRISNRASKDYNAAKRAVLQGAKP